MTTTTQRVPPPPPTVDRPVFDPNDPISPVVRTRTGFTVDRTSRPGVQRPAGTTGKVRVTDLMRPGYGR
jgi:hypothetical protein